MKKYYHLLGIAIIIGGFISIALGSRDVIKLKLAKYSQSSTSRIMSINAETSIGKKYWLTEEEMRIGDQTLSYHGKYEHEPKPNGTIVHTLISDDGLYWEVNDTSAKSVFFGTITGLIYIFLGNILIYFNKINNISDPY